MPILYRVPMAYDRWIPSAIQYVTATLDDRDQQTRQKWLTRHEAELSFAVNRSTWRRDLGAVQREGVAVHLSQGVHRG